MKPAAYYGSPRHHLDIDAREVRLKALSYASDVVRSFAAHDTPAKDVVACAAAFEKFLLGKSKIEAVKPRRNKRGSKSK